MEKAAEFRPEVQPKDGNADDLPNLAHSNTGKSEQSKVPVHPTFSSVVRGALWCPTCREGDLAAADRTGIRSRYETALSRWQAAGCPDLGDWPPRGKDLVEYSLEVIERVLTK